MYISSLIINLLVFSYHHISFILSYSEYYMLNSTCHELSCHELSVFLRNCVGQIATLEIA